MFTAKGSEPSMNHWGELGIVCCARDLSILRKALQSPISLSLLLIVFAFIQE